MRSQRWRGTTRSWCYSAILHLKGLTKHECIEVQSSQSPNVSDLQIQTQTLFVHAHNECWPPGDQQFNVHRAVLLVCSCKLDSWGWAANIRLMRMSCKYETHEDVWLFLKAGRKSFIWHWRPIQGHPWGVKKGKTSCGPATSGAHEGQQLSCSS